jgi:serine protease Do
LYRGRSAGVFLFVQELSPKQLYNSSQNSPGEFVMRRFYITALVLLFLIAALLPLQGRFTVSAVTDGERQAMYTKPGVVRIRVASIGAFAYEDTEHSVSAREYKFSDGEQGSGFFISPDGYICTNAHVVQMVHDGDEKAQQNLIRQFVFWVGQNIYKIDPRSLTQSNFNYIYQHSRLTGFYMVHEVVIADGSVFTFELKPAGYGAPTGENENAKDVAIIKIEVKNAPVLKFGDSDTVQLQDPIRVWGYPGAADVHNPGWVSDKSALEASGNPGEVSAKKASAGGAPILQVSAPTAPGNSGGPVLNAKNEVIGLLTFGSTQTQGFNYAVTSDTAMEFVKAVGVKNDFGPADKLYREGLELYWAGHYKEAMPKFEEVKRLFPQHPVVNQLIQSSQQAITEGKDQSGMSATSWVVIVVLAVLFLIVAVVIIGVVGFLLLRKRGKAKPAIPGATAAKPAPSLATNTPAAKAGSYSPSPAQPAPYSPVSTPAAPSPYSAPPAASTPLQRPPMPQMTVLGTPGDKTMDLSATIAIAPEVDTAPIGYGAIKFISGALAGQRFEIKPEGACIGRDGSLAQIVITDPRISKRHLWIGVKDGRVAIADQGSRNGTFLNDPKSPRVTETSLTPGDTVILGESDVARFEYMM